MNNKEIKQEFLLLIDHSPVSLKLVRRTGYCLVCQLETTICLVAQRLTEWINEKSYCQPCAISSLDLLENGGYQLENKWETKLSPQEVINQIRQQISNN